ncbi:hypothetical protein LCGC14_1431300 [marine sediment metagenome]|uniref:Gene product 88 domain-containing protein n=1 Tax=marine sediment metagenome TaxID=412755 RepID=A0A0F9K9P4_9ZZZZ
MQAFTQNSKTILSIDFDRFATCPTICSYCYVGNMERIYPAYKAKIENNVNWAKDNPENFAAQLNTEYRKHRKSKAKNYSGLEKLPVRVYGAGDYHPIHYEWMKKVEFKFFIISKTLTLPHMHNELRKLLKLKKLTKVCLSFDQHNLENYRINKKFFKKDKINFAYTGMADEFNSVKSKKYNFDIFFNISNKRIEKEKSRLIKEQCPCDSGVLAHNKSCSICSKCWRSSVTQKNWNIM